jgi:uncharacterized membrane protein
MTMTTTMTKAKPKSSSWDNRTRFVVSGLVFLFFVSWMMALGRLIGTKFWNPTLNLKNAETLLSMSKEQVSKELPNLPWFIPVFIKNIGISYYTTRYVVFFPHVVGSIVWWNLYFFQLIPSIRRKYKKFHRVLGRVLMICALAQTISGIGLAYMGNSSTIKIVSTFLAIAIVYCTYYAWYYAAIAKDIPKHKYWATRLVGYLQTIAFQRVFMFALMASHEKGWNGLYPPLNENNGSEILKNIFDDSFICSILAGIYFTEWYLAGVYGWTATTTTTKTTATSTVTVTAASTAPAITAPAEVLGEKKPLLKATSSSGSSNSSK